MTNPMHFSIPARAMKLATVVSVVALCVACGGSDPTSSPATSADPAATSIAPATSTTTAVAAPTSTTADAASGAPDTAAATVTAACFPGGVVPAAVDSAGASYSASGCTVTVHGDGDAFWASQGYHRVDVLGAVYVNEDLRCAVNSGLPGAQPDTEVWSVLCGKAFPDEVLAQVTASTTGSSEVSDQDLAAGLWPAGLSLPNDFVFSGAQEHPDQAFVDFTIEYTGAGIAEESFWNWANANLDGIDPAESDGGQNVSYQSRHIEIHQMSDSLFRLFVAN